jgi:hypothetical protein
VNSLKYQTLSSLSIAARNHKVPIATITESMFLVLDAGEEGLPVIDLIGKTVRSRTSAQEVKAGLMQSKLAVELPRRRTRARLAPTEQLPNAAQGYNEILLEMIQDELPSLSRSLLGGLALQKHALSHQIDHCQPVEEIVRQVGERQHWHPQSVLYRALGGFAFDQGIYTPVISEIEAAIRAHSPPAVAPPQV